MRHASARKLFRERRRPYLCLPSRCRQLPAASTAARVHHSADAVIRLPALVLPDVARLYRKHAPALQDSKSLARPRPWLFPVPRSPADTSPFRYRPERDYDAQCDSSVPAPAPFDRIRLLHQRARHLGRVLQNERWCPATRGRVDVRFLLGRETPRSGACSCETGHTKYELRASWGSAQWPAGIPAPRLSNSNPSLQSKLVRHGVQLACRPVPPPSEPTPESEYGPLRVLLLRGRNRHGHARQQGSHKQVQSSGPFQLPSQNIHEPWPCLRPFPS